MQGTIERIKNNVLQKCNNLNDSIINNSLVKLIDSSIYKFAEDVLSIINGTIIDITEDDLRKITESIIKKELVKKFKRKLFIDSLALQITNDYFIEECINKNITINKLKDDYLNELIKNENSNQLNMSENMDISEYINSLKVYFDNNIINVIKENVFMVNSIYNTINSFSNELKQKLDEKIDDLNNKYLDILINELEEETGEFVTNDNMEENDMNNEGINEKTINKFDKYDDMTLYNKTILSLNTKEEKLLRKENKLEAKKKEIEEKLSKTNDDIEKNIKRENELSQKKLDLNEKEIELNTKLSETEVIFLNMKPLINGLNKIKDNKRGGEDE